MTTALTTYAGYADDEVALIKAHVAQGVSDSELAYFLKVAQSTGLSPLHRQIYAIMRNTRTKDANGRWVSTPRMTIQTGIDGYLAIADRTGAYAGIDDATFLEGPDDHPTTATVSVYRLVQGKRARFTFTARWSEYAQMYDGEPSGLWKKMPYTMLAKCATSRALRLAFPAQLTGIYTHEEMQQADNEYTPPVTPPVATQTNIVTGEVIEAPRQSAARPEPPTTVVDGDSPFIDRPKPVRKPAKSTGPKARAEALGWDWNELKAAALGCEVSELPAPTEFSPGQQETILEFLAGEEKTHSLREAGEFAQAVRP